MNMADVRRDWLTNQNTDCCFVVIGLVGRQSHSPLLQLKIDPVRQMGLPYWVAPSGCQKICINIRGQYDIRRIFIYIRGPSRPTVAETDASSSYHSWFLQHPPFSSVGAIYSNIYMAYTTN